jgi:uncharacterized damage-inducible protein DinB
MMHAAFTEKPFMIPAKTARMLTRYNTWSNKVWHDAIAALPQGEAMKPRASLFGNIVHTMNHIYVIDLIWQAHLEGRDHHLTARNSAQSPTLEEWWTQQHAIDQWYEQWSDKQTDETLADRRPVVLIGGNRVVMSQAEMLLHLYHHTAYHRGYAGDMIFNIAGQRAPVTDLPVFLREAPQSY